MRSPTPDPKYAIPVLTLLLALAVEIGAWLLAERLNAVLAGYLALHAVSSLLLALALLPLVPFRSARSRAATLLLMFACGYTIPVLGFLGVIAAFPLLRRIRSRAEDGEFESLQLPEFDPQQHLKSGIRAAGLRAFLADDGVPVAERERAMAMLQSLAGRAAIPILHDMLRSSNEDLRLLAYGMLNRFEIRSGHAIDLQRNEFERVEPDSLQALRSARNLSDIYWELAESGLAQDDLRVHAIREALRYCEHVLQVHPDDGPMQVRRARLRHDAGDLQGAEGNYGLARALGAPAQRVLPHLARAYFEQREFARVHSVMNELKRWRALPRLRRVIDYWEGACP
jgi:hypothetical protein